MKWDIEFLPEAVDDLKQLDGSVRPQVLKGIQRVAQSPDSDGYGKPLGNNSGTALSGLMKIKFKKIGIRVVYKLKIQQSVMKIIIISAREDNRVYNEAQKRREKYNI